MARACPVSTSFRRSTNVVWVALGLCLAYYLFADGLPGGQSLGKRLFGIAVVQEGTGKPCGWLRSALRNVTQVAGWADWLWILGKERKRVGDHVAGTRVIKLR